MTVIPGRLSGGACVHKRMLDLILNRLARFCRFFDETNVATYHTV
jgi:hypothetical protein